MNTTDDELRRLTEERAEVAVARVAQAVREMWLAGEQGTAVVVMGEIITISRERAL